MPIQDISFHGIFPGVRRLTDSDVHGMRSHCDNRPDYEAQLTHNSHLLSPKQVGQRAHKRTESRIGDEVSDDEPNVSINSTNILIDERKN